MIQWRQRLCRQISQTVRFPIYHLWGIPWWLVALDLYCWSCDLSVYAWIPLPICSLYSVGSISFILLSEYPSIYLFIYCMIFFNYVIKNRSITLDEILKEISWKLIIRVHPLSRVMISIYLIIHFPCFFLILIFLKNICLYLSIILKV